MNNIKRNEHLLELLSDFPDGAKLSDILAKLETEVTARTLQRWLGGMTKQGLITIEGSARGTRYFTKAAEAAPDKETEKAQEILIPLSEQAKNALANVAVPIQQRPVVGYQQDFLKSYRPNIDSYLSKEEKKQLAEIGDNNVGAVAGTYAQQILNRLLIDLSWNSSRLEGNTYSLLDTQRLIEYGEADDQKSAKEAQMILNHKDAIEFLVQAAEEIGYNRYTLLNLHAMLANNLLPDPEAPGRLRSIAVGITGTSFTPLAIPQLIEKYFDLIMEKAGQILDPFEQSFFLMVHLPYLQPFDDVNKRVSRLAANIPMIKKNLAPLSFIDVPEDLYFKGVMAIYEQNDIHLLKDVYLWSYERSASRYRVIRQSLGEPDTFKLKYRTAIRELITTVIVKEIEHKNLAHFIRENAQAIDEQDREEFIKAVEQEIMSLHEGNFARYRVSPSEFRRWKENGR
ncbi:Fic family protein [Pedobacter jamesrossensis]|uniref:Fic family protein n=1 Tax=Pedobacter jamesrossensis TaxID=1908238 RepID=A0ABV8NRA4_9SPHI